MSLQPPSIEDLIKFWEKDSQIDITEPGREILQIPKLHSKYVKFLTLHNLAAKRCAIEFNKLKKLKWLYYNGKMSKEELEKLNWEPFRFTLKSDLAVYIESDQELNKISSKKSYHEEASAFCTHVLKELSNRTWQLREYMTHERFIQGAR
jgi:hypothetical protein